MVAPFLALLFVLSADAARVFYCQATLYNCARNGALYAANLGAYNETDWVNLSSNTKQAAIQDGSGLSPALTTSNVAVSSGKGSDGNPNVTVTVTYTFTTVTQFPGIPSSWSLTATSKMRSQ